MQIYSKILLVTIIQNIFVFNKVNSQGQPILLVIGYDGFRNDYLDRGITPTLSNFRANGVHSEFLKTVYPPLAAPAFHSISTGLYPENHGILGRKYINSDGTEEKEMDDNTMFTQTDNTPIWLLNQKNGGKSLCIMWPGGDANYEKSSEANGECSISETYLASDTLKTRADKIIDNLKKDSKINLVMFYVEQLDRITHFFGPLSRNSTLFIRRLDLLTKYIIQKLIEIRVYHRTNIFIISDHGMISIDKTKDKIDPAPKFVYTGSTDHIDDVNARAVFPFDYEANKEDKDKLKEFVKPYVTATDNFARTARTDNKYKIVRIPNGYEMEAGTIEYAACPGFILELTSTHVKAFEDKYSAKLLNNKKEEGENCFGVHGYLRQNDALFMAKGPLLTRFKKVEPFEMVDLYSAFARILNIHGDYERDGNFSRVLPIFPEHRPVQWVSIIVSIFGLAVFFTVVYYFTIEFIVERIQS